MTIFESPFGNLVLERQPPDRSNTLRAWNQADFMLLNACASLPDWRTARHLVVNDRFGALTCALLKGGVSQLHWWHDSAMSLNAMQSNLARNALSPDNLFIHQMPACPPEVDYVWLSIPKQIDLLRWQLSSLQSRRHAIRQTTLGIMTKYESPNLATCLNEYFVEWHRSRAEKKARLYHASLWKTTEPEQDQTTWYHTEFPERRCTLFNLPGTFSAQKIDVGGRLLADSLPDIAPERVLDLGCGNGLLGLAAIDKYPEAEIIFVDESSMAIASAQKTVQRNRPKAQERCRFLWFDGTQPLPTFDVDLVLCNPPFHQHEVITTSIAELLFRRAYECLKVGGYLWVVANRHLPYQPRFRTLFGGYQVIKATRKFVVYGMQKRQRGSSSRRFK